MFFNKPIPIEHMKCYRAAVLLFASLIMITAAHSFESDRSDEGPTIINSDPDTQCWNGIDDDNDGRAPADESSGQGPFDTDPGCVNPYWNDSNEGMIMDTHFTATMEGLNPNNGMSSEGSESFTVDSTESLFFENRVRVGSSQDTIEDRTDTSTSSTSKTFYYIDAQRTESDQAYGFGMVKSREVSVSDFSDYDSLFGNTNNNQEVYFSGSENRFIDTPHDESDVCGNGMEDSTDDDVNIDLNPLGNEKGYTNGNFIDCRGDYGRILMKYDMDGNEDSAEHNYKNDDLECNTDDGNAQTINEDGGECGGCRGVNSPGGADCGGSKQDYTDSEGTNYYENPDDLIEEYECTRDETCADGKGSSAVYSECDSTDIFSYIDDCDSSDCGPCGNETSWDTGGFDTTYCGQGHIRSWSGVQDSTNCDNSYSVVDGGSRINDGRFGNDPAATYTKFTSYADDTWTDEDNKGDHSDDTEENWVDGTGKVWGGYEFAATVNADGPKGNGDGFIVIDEKAGSGSDDIDRVVGRESPNGEGLVGKNVYYGVRNAGESDGSATTVLDHDIIDKVDLSCTGRSETCIKYVDFWTEGPGADGTPGDPAWTIDPSNSDNPTKAEIVEATKVKTEEYTLDKSYSVCKAANRIAEENPESAADNLDWSNGEALVDCDYMRDEDGDDIGENISPLPQACGDEEEEHLMVMEGPSVNSERAENWLGYEQKCVNMRENDPNGRPLDSDACVNKGKAYAEGTVMEVESNLLDPEFEEGGESPDYHVCLDLKEQDGEFTDNEMAPKPYNYRYNAKPNDFYSDQGYYGGQWYDLDDERINDFLQAVEDGSESLPEGIDSDTAGSPSQEDDYIDYYFTYNPNPYHEDYNPYGDGSPDGNRGTALVADCGPLLDGCGDDGENLRGEVAAPGFDDDFSGTEYEGEGTYQAFSDPSEETFHEWSRDDDYNPQGEESTNAIEPVFTGQLNKIKSASDQLESGHPDYNILNNPDWWFTTNVNEDKAVQYSYTLRDDWLVDSTGVPYPPGGGSSSAAYTTSDEASAGTYHHIDQSPNILRGSVVDDTILKTRKAHGNSIAVVASQEITESSSTSPNGNIQEGEGYWINPDDIKTEWENGNIDRSYW